jgi:hypothetical protein
MLYNTADMERGGGGDGDTVAILEGTQLCATRQLRDLLPTLGGVSALLPPLAQLGRASSDPKWAKGKKIVTKCAFLAPRCCRRSRSSVGGVFLWALIFFFCKFPVALHWSKGRDWHLLCASSTVLIQAGRALATLTRGKSQRGRLCRPSCCVRPAACMPCFP